MTSQIKCKLLKKDTLKHFLMQLMQKELNFLEIAICLPAQTNKFNRLQKAITIFNPCPEYLNQGETPFCCTTQQILQAASMTSDKSPCVRLRSIDTQRRKNKLNQPPHPFLMVTTPKLTDLLVAPSHRPFHVIAHVYPKKRTQNTTLSHQAAGTWWKIVSFSPHFKDFFQVFCCLFFSRSSAKLWKTNSFFPRAGKGGVKWHIANTDFVSTASAPESRPASSTARRQGEWFMISEA